MAFRVTSTGGWAELAERAEDRALPARTAKVSSAPIPYSPYSEPPVPSALNVTTGTVLRLADAWACVRVLADSISTLPLHCYRRTATGRQPAGEKSRVVQLLQSPAPGSTGVDLISTIMVDLAVFGETFLGLYRGGDGEIAQLACISPERMDVELQGQRIVYVLHTEHGDVELGPDDVLHVKGVSMDGLRGMSPVTQCRVALGLSSALQESARQFFAHGSRPSGILTVPGPRGQEALQHIREAWNAQHAGVQNMHRVPVVSNDVAFTPVAFSAQDSDFLGQRELSTREIARIFRVPAWCIDGATGGSLTYSNVTEQNRALVVHSLRPWATRIEKAISNCTALCPGNQYVQFDFDGLLRAAPEQRADQYTKALHPVTGWMTRAECRELEDLPPEPERTTPPTAPVRGEQEQDEETVNRPTPGTPEDRSAPDTTPVVDGRKLRGLIPVGVESRDMGGWLEVLDPGALDNTDLSDLIATREHDRSKLLRRHPSTLEVERTEEGLRWAVELPHSPVGEDVRVAVERGDLRSSSWRQVVARDYWVGNVRHVAEISHLLDVTVTAAPAYLTAAAELRSTPETDQSPTTPVTDQSNPGEALEDNMGTEPENTTVTPDGENRSAPTGGLTVEDRVAVTRERPRGLADEFRAAGFPGEVATVPFERFEDRAVTWTGSVDNVNSVQRQAGALGADQRYAWPAMPRVNVDAGATSVTVLTQSARSLASATNVVRAIDAVTAKPETVVALVQESRDESRRHASEPGQPSRTCPHHCPSRRHVAGTGPPQGCFSQCPAVSVRTSSSTRGGWNEAAAGPMRLARRRCRAHPLRAGAGRDT